MSASQDKDLKDAHTIEQEVVSNIKTNLTCQICEKLFFDPRILPCLHTFCCNCIETLLRNRPLKDKLLKCPTCQLETGLEDRKSVRKLPVNSLLISLLDLLLIQQGEAIECDVCDSSEESFAQVRCRECSLYLCGLHAEAHKKARDTKQHVLLSFEHLKTMSLKELNRPTYCTTHADERLALFCDTCNVSICRNCGLTDHRKHHTQFLEDAYSKLRPRLSQALEKTRNVCVKVENAIPTLEWMQARVNLKADGVLREIEDSFNTKIKALEQRRNELRTAVELVRVNRKTSLEIQKKRLEASRDTLRVSCRFVKRVLEEGDPVYLLSAKDILSERLDTLAADHYELQPREDHAISFTADNETLQGLIDSFGSVDASYASFATSTAEGPGLQEASINQPAYFTVVTRDRKGRPIDCESDDVRVQIETPDGNMTDADVTAQNGGKHSVTYTPCIPGQHRLHVTIRSCQINEGPFAVNVPYKTRDYENMNHPELVIGGPGAEPGQLKGARGITVDRSNRIIVCDRNNFRVQVFDKSGEFLSSFGTKGSADGEFPGGPLSVAVSKDGTFYISDWSGGLVQVFDTKGEFLKRLKIPQGDDIKCGKCQVVVGDDCVYVADCQNRYIYIFNSAGEYLSHFKVGCMDEGDGLQSKLYGIAINSRGEIIASLANDGGFQVLNQEGEILRSIPLPFPKTNKVFAPEAITVDCNDNILIVDSMKNCLLVFSAEDGHLIAECARESICNPFGVAVDKTGRVIITDSSNQIKVF